MQWYTILKQWTRAYSGWNATLHGMDTLARRLFVILRPLVHYLKSSGYWMQDDTQPPCAVAVLKITGPGAKRLDLTEYHFFYTANLHSLLVCGALFLYMKRVLRTMPPGPHLKPPLPMWEYPSLWAYGFNSVHHDTLVLSSRGRDVYSGSIQYVLLIWPREVFKSIVYFRSGSVEL